ncbi:TPA: DinI-like family protein [Klebsiella pneumoniae]|uniref:DinI-like family protein n=3 Tax=Klebsiella TaxID=570 RepID=A0A7H0EW78_KLEVA|nr:hypothetical protein CA210_00100 [Raoultella ornithinolytica]AUT25430.1 hypothetical protein CEA73_26995 [Klebsiella pneumoniae]EHT9909513.1 DinI-like family protein [Klebsiella oxytoca]EIY2679105.1 DinI-like family protein [Raoultella planticola]EKU0049822.1 DinI-like family protein [Klebsiella quasipneumoniae]EKU2797189.1 DinI-like family protein [Klebsiella variicola]EKV7900205.1 DinI-like family protein [Klebsiella michiganensis]MDT1877039.1 DinI family protein [Acinetobacter baumanni
MSCLITKTHSNRNGHALRGYTDASKHEKEQIGRVILEMFEEADMWMSGE